MKSSSHYLSLLLSFILLYSCSSEGNNSSGIVLSEFTSSFSADLKELSDEDYPDNPDISIRHKKYVETEMNSISFNQNEDAFDLIITPSNNEDDTVIMQGVKLMEFIPSIPHCTESDEYMKLISVVNQEWNRNQVKWTGDALQDVLPKKHIVNGEVITRIDLARNCLSSYLWELFFYCEVDGKNKVFYHGWFHFPEQLYKDLFEERNHDNFDKFAQHLVNWKDPKNQKLNLDLIRNVSHSLKVDFINHDEEMYPLYGERKKKEIAIIYPENYSKMSDFHTDSALFATFTAPGFYNRKEPRTTELGRFHSLKNVEYRTTTNSTSTVCDELKMVFSREDGEVTKFVFGGMDFSTLPKLSTEECNSGNSYPMGIGNHPFYEDCKSHEELCSLDNPYFGVLLNTEGHWLDSHKIGIDGPLLHLDKENPNIIHVWLLSFERHAIVGHYEINLSNITAKTAAL